MRGLKQKALSSPPSQLQLEGGLDSASRLTPDTVAPPRRLGEEVKRFISNSRGDQLHTRCATSATSRSFFSCVASAIGFPTITEAKPHCVESAICSRGK